MTSLSPLSPNPNGVRCRTIVLTEKGLRATGAIPPGDSLNLDDIVWIPIVRLPWYEDKRKDGAL